MTAPRPEAVELYDKLMACPFTAHSTLELLDAALTAARADERERAAKVCEAMTKEIVCPEECAAAIRAMEGR